MRNIVVNTRNLNSPKTGVQRYTEEILKVFPENSFSTKKPDKSFSNGAKGHFWEQLILPRQINSNDILWSPSNTGPISHKNQVVTIHDVVSFDHPEWLNKQFSAWYRFHQPKLVRNSKKVITISNFSKERIMHYLKVPDSKIEVIYLGVGNDFLNVANTSIEKIKKYTQTDKYILSLGSLEPRKNLKRLLKCWTKIECEFPDDFKLIVVGKKGSSKVFNDAGIQECLSNVIFTGHVSDNHLPALYNHAKAFFYLSEYEGFGLPPLEAMATKTPVVVSNRTAIPEVVGNLGVLIDPFNDDEIIDSIRMAYAGKVSNKETIEKAYQRAIDMNWNKASEKTWNVINN